jgi:hypothetical protein
MTRALAGLAGLVVVAGLLSGCGDDGNDEPDAAPPTSDAPVESLAEPDPPVEDDEGGEDGAPSPRDSGLPIPRTYDDALAHFDALGSEPLNVRRFVMPSGNIYCAVKVKGIAPGCEINEGAVEDPAVCAGTPTDEVGRVQFVGGRAAPVCNTDTIRQPKAPVLDYGVAARWRNFRIMCLSESIGVTCINTKKVEGFFLHRGEYVIFNAG